MRRALLVCALALPAAIGHADDAGTAAAAQAPSRSVAVAITPGERVALGSLITVRMKIDTAPGEEVSVPEQPLAPFELVDRRASQTALPGGGQAHLFEIDVLALEVGDSTLPAITLRVVGPKGELSELHTTPRVLAVSSPLANEPSAAPKPPAQPVSVMEEDYTLAWLGGGLAATAAIAALTLLIARALKRRQKPLPPPPPPPPAWQRALGKLAALQNARDIMLAESRGAEFVEAVGNVAREYLGERYGFDGLERTTDELMQTLSQLRPTELRLADVALLLEQCDLVKFARVTPDAAVCSGLFDAVKALVHGSMPRAGEP